MIPYHNILRDYLRKYTVPAMLEQGWAFKAAKSYGWAHAERPEYQIDQPLRTHILNGLYALTGMLEYLDKKGYYHLSEIDFKRTLVLYTLHDAYKDSEIASERMGNSDFSIPLAPLNALVERMGLRKFAPVKAEDIRAASVSLRSHKVGDLSSCSPGISHLLTLVHLADALASQQTAGDYKTTENRLQELIRSDAITASQQERMRQRLGTTADLIEVKPPLTFYFHELDDYRGLSTLLIHQATENVLDTYGLYPILYFANGTLYLGPEKQVFNPENLRKKIATTVFSRMKDGTGGENEQAGLTVARDGLKYGQSLKFRKDTYLFCSLPSLIEAIQEYPLAKKSSGFVAKIIDKRVSRRKYNSREDFYSLYQIPLNTDGDEALAQRWNAAYYLCMGLEDIAGALIPGDTLEWLLSTFHTPAEIAILIRQNSSVLHTGGVSDHCIVIAYHWLINARFLSGQRTALEVETINVQQEIAEQALQALTPFDTQERRSSFVNKELGIQHDLENYLATNLTFSFHPQRLSDESPLSLYEKPRSRSSHKRTCLICNRNIPSEMQSSDIITTIAEQQALVFSNKLTPAEEVKGQMVWCPMCYLEFMLRKLSGQSYPAGSDFNASYRLYLYILPDYSFTPQLWHDVGEDLLGEFHPQETTVSRLALRGSKEAPAIPTQWLEGRKVDPDWLKKVQEMFAHQAAYMKTPTKEGKPRGKQGDRLAFSFKNPNYMLITYDNVVSDRMTPAEKSKVAPTRSEIWAKAIYSAVLIHLLTGVRVYITDKPYLTITRPDQMKTIIEMEGLPPLLYGLLPIRRTDIELPDIGIRPSESSSRVPLAALPVLLDLLASTWEVNAALYQGKQGERRNLDKQVASILEEIRSNYLAGATLYKARERDKAPPYPAFTRACQILLPQTGEQSDEIRKTLYTEGYELMMDKEGGELMNLAEKLTETSLKLYIPSSKKEGRAHRFETLFRTGVEAIKVNANHSDNEDELAAKVAGTVLKRLERLLNNDGFGPAYGTAQLQAVKEFSEILVKELFGKRCGQSVSKLTHEENHLADAIYFLTFQKINLYWEEYNRQHPKKANQAGADENGHQE